MPAVSPDSSHCHRLALVGAVDPLLLDLVGLSLQGEDALVIAAQFRPEEGGYGAVHLTAVDPDAGLGSGEPVAIDVPMSFACQTCSLRDVLLAVAEDRANMEPVGATVVLLPPALELVHLVPRLAAEVERLDGVRLAGVAHVISTDTAVEDLLFHRPLAERALAAPGDERCTGEVHMVGLGYADLIIAVGARGPGADLIEHLRADSALLISGLDAPLLPELLGIRHDAAVACARVHPATMRAWGGPVSHGVRTLDLFSERPFHPGRLRSLVAELAGEGMCARGCFWLPSRPGRVCAWEVAGGAISVADAGMWAEVPVLDDGNCRGSGLMEPRCHLIVTGIADDEVCERTRRAFSQVLLRDDEMAEALSWAGVDDGLSDWFGESA